MHEARRALQDAAPLVPSLSQNGWKPQSNGALMEPRLLEFMVVVVFAYVAVTEWKLEVMD